MKNKKGNNYMLLAVLILILGFIFYYNSVNQFRDNLKENIMYFDSLISDINDLLDYETERIEELKEKHLHCDITKFKTIGDLMYYGRQVNQVYERYDRITKDYDDLNDKYSNLIDLYFSNNKKIFYNYITCSNTCRNIYHDLHNKSIRIKDQLLTVNAIANTVI